MESLTHLYRLGFGPSSSHTMGPAKAAALFLADFPAAARYEVILYGSLAATGHGHLTDVKIKEAFAPHPVTVIFSTKNVDLPHPNTMDFIAYDAAGNPAGTRRVLSLGGGAIRVVGAPWQEPAQIYPFRNFSEILAYSQQERMSLPGIVDRFEGPGIRDYLKTIWQTMNAAIDRGLSAEGTLPGSLHLVRKAPKMAHPLPNEIASASFSRKVMGYAYAAAEENAAGGIVVTAPTCGSSGIVPAVLRFLKESRHLEDPQIIDALEVASLIGNVIKMNASISGAECGCQAEIGTATAMASAAIAYLDGLTNEQIECAAEVSLEHHLGLTCDPVDGYVQIPCIERNAVCAMRAFDSVNIARYLSEVRQVSFDAVVRTMYETGHDLVASYRETALGGLAKIFSKR